VTLNSAHAHLAALVESSHDAIFSLSLDRRVLSWNPSAERQFGYTAAEMIGQDIILIFPKGRHHEKDDLFERLKRDGFFRHETQRKRKDGGIIDVELTIAPIRNSAHEMEAISVISRDITSLKAILADSEAANEIIEDQAIQLDAIFDALRSPLLIFDRHGRPVRANAQARQLFGFAADTPLSCSHEEMSRQVQVRDSDGGPIRTNVLPSRRALAGELVEAEEQWITGADRIQRIFQCSAMPLRNTSGINGAVVIFHDISELKRRASHNLVLLRELSHRSKNLLSVVQSIALRSSRSPGSKQDFVDRLASRLRGLANAQDLLSHSSNLDISISDLIFSQIGHLWEAGTPRISLYGKNVRLLPAAAQNLGIALHELSTNALKYGALSTPGGRVEVRWAVERPASGRFTFVLSWREFDGPPVTTPTRHGFGRTVTETIAARALAGECRLRFDPAGVHWELSAPLNLISHSGAESPITD
jgi:PAS domain S-box-containing protein